MENETQQIVVSPPAAQLPQAVTPMALLSMAVSSGADIEKLEKLMALHERWDANEARKAFVTALAAFKSEPLTITKDKHVSFGKEGYKTEYSHATLGNITDIISARLSQHGLSYRWATEQVDGKIKVTCTLMHSLGHSESVSLESGADTSGAKNSIQAIGSAISYLQRYTLMAITGCAAQDQDDDGRTGGFTAADVMDESKLCDYLAAIETATTQKALLPLYLQALEQASGLGDKDAATRISAAKEKAIARMQKS